MNQTCTFCNIHCKWTNLPDDGEEEFQINGKDGQTNSAKWRFKTWRWSRKCSSFFFPTQTLSSWTYGYSAASVEFVSLFWSGCQLPGLFLPLFISWCHHTHQGTICCKQECCYLNLLYLTVDILHTTAKWVQGRILHFDWQVRQNSNCYWWSLMIGAVKTKIVKAKMAPWARMDSLFIFKEFFSPPNS